MKQNKFFKNKDSFFKQALVPIKSLGERSLAQGISNAKMTLMRRNVSMKKIIPSAITKGRGLVGRLALGAVAMTNLAILKGSNKQNINMLERFMYDLSSSRNLLNITRLGMMDKRSKINQASTIGLSNALYASRHNRY